MSEKEQNDFLNIVRKRPPRYYAINMILLLISIIVCFIGMLVTVIWADTVAFSIFYIFNLIVGVVFGVNLMAFYIRFGDKYTLDLNHRNKD